MAKPVPRRIPSDDCEVTIDGEVYRPHEGEWVEMISSESVGELRIRVELAQLGPKLEALEGEPDAGIRYNALMDAHYVSLCEHLAERVVAWNWTDLRGRPLSPPTDDQGRPLGLLRLRANELYWLMNAVAPQESAESRKNG